MSIEIPDRPPDHEIIWPDESGDVSEIRFTGGASLSVEDGRAFVITTGAQPYLTVNEGEGARFIAPSLPAAPRASLMVMEVRVMTELLPGSGERDSRFQVDTGDLGARDLGASFAVAARAIPPFAPEQWSTTFRAGPGSSVTTGLTYNHWRYIIQATPRGGQWEASESPTRPPVAGDLPAPSDLRAWPPSLLYLEHLFGNQPRPRLYAVNLWYEPATTGMPPLRQRQNGLNSGGPPLRHRQNGLQTGGPPLRHRQ